MKSLGLGRVVQGRGLNSAWCLYGHPYINWVTNKELKNMEKDFVVILCLSASKVWSLVFLWGGFQCDDQIFAQQLGTLSICQGILSIDAFKT